MPGGCAVREGAMIHQVILPKLGTNMEEGTILEWRKAEGEKVSRGEVLLVVETSKAIFEVEAESDGYLRKVLAREGFQVRFTEPVGLLTDKAEEDVGGFRCEDRPEKRVKRYHEEKREELTNSTAKGPNVQGYTATPAAKRASGELKIDLGSIARLTGAAVIDERAVTDFAGRKKIAIYGAGLGVKQAKELLRFSKDLIAIGLFDDNPGIKGSEIAGLKVLGGWADMISLSSKKEIDGVAISLHSEHRRKLIEKIRAQAPDVELIPLVDVRAILGEGVVISSGAFIEAGSIIGPETFVGEGAIVDTGAVVSHDCYIGAHSHLSPGCCLSGIVRLEGNVLVGVGASVNSQVMIGRNAVITPGSAVMSDVPDNVVVSGNPARIIGKSFRGA